MDFLHLQIGHVSRSTGRSAVQAVAYITGTRLYEERRGIIADYRNRKGVLCWENLAPEGSGIDKGDLWNRIENFEDEYADRRYKDPEACLKYKGMARTSQTYVLALPKELPSEKNIELVREFATRRFVSQGLVVTYGIHVDKGNPHAHLNVSMRPVFSGELSWTKTYSRTLATRQGIRETRILAAEIINNYQEQAGLSDRVDPRSFVDRGLDLLPSQHKGWVAHQLERQGKPSRIGYDNALIDEENKRRIVNTPSIILKELTSKQATFSQTDVVRLVQKRLKDDAGVLVTYVIEEVLKEAVEVGIGVDSLKRYTSQEYAAKEAFVLESLQACGKEKAFLALKPKQVEKALNTSDFTLTEEQKAAVRVLCGDAQLSVMIGRAGTGKTTALKAVVEAHSRAGYEVWGMAPSATAAGELGKSTGCRSDTIAHYAYFWKMYHSAVEELKQASTDTAPIQARIDQYAEHLPGKKTLLLMDEAGMVGVGGWSDAIPGGLDSVIKTLAMTHSKLILVGDDHQFKSVEAGDVFRKAIEVARANGSLCELEDIKRQQIPWMKEASRHLAALNTGTALEMYEHQGHMDAYQSPEEVYQEMARQYLRNCLREPDSKGLVLAYENAECQALNDSIRAMLKDNGLLGDDQLTKGEKGYAVGDQIVFTRNDRGYHTRITGGEQGFYVKNGLLAIIESIKACQYQDQKTKEPVQTCEIIAYVKENPRTKVCFYLNDYDHFSHGYAITSHKSQGATADWSLIKISRQMDAYGLYMTLTHHRYDTTLYYAHSEFKDFSCLIKSAGKVSYKDLMVDYSIGPDHHEYWVTVQEYKALGQELLSLSLLARKEETEDSPKIDKKELWKEYRQLEEERKHLANFILEDRDNHVDFIRQAGLTIEALEIVAGHRKRPLSRLEIQAQLVAEQYTSLSLETRKAWDTICKTHRSRSHPDWEKFDSLRQERGALASRIIQNPTLYKPFLKESYGINVIKSQAQAYQAKLLYQEFSKAGNEDQGQRAKVLLEYVEARDLCGSLWKALKPQLKQYEGTLLADSFSKQIEEFNKSRMVRDQQAFQIVEQLEDYQKLSQKIGFKLDIPRLFDQKDQAIRDTLLNAYTTGGDKLKAAFELYSLIGEEKETGKKITIRQVYDRGINVSALARDAVTYQKGKVFEGLKSDSERQLFTLLDTYEAECQRANQIYVKCLEEIKSDEKLKPWQSSHYGSYKLACEERDKKALEVFNRWKHDEVVSLAGAMSMRFKEVDLSELFSRGEQAIRTQHILSYLKAETSQERGEAAIALRQLIEIERRQKGVPSKTAQQAFYAGIDFKEMSTVAFAYKRACVLKSLTSEKESQLYHALEAYETALRPANSAYKECLEESKACSLKPWETKKFKDYLCLLTIQDDKAHQLLKGYDAPSIETIAKEMGISVKKLDVEAHRHYLRKTLQLFTQGDITTVPMAAKELLKWLEFDRHSDFKYTFKVLREQDLWPKALQESLSEFFLKKRRLKHHQEHAHKQERDGAIQESDGSIKDASYTKAPFSDIEQQLKGKMEDLALQLFPSSPTGRSTNQLRFGRKGSISVFIKGPKQGVICQS